MVPRLRVAGFDEPDLTYFGDEHRTIGQAEVVLRSPEGRIENFAKPPGTAHFLCLVYHPYYWAMKHRFGWRSADDVQWWRVRRYWRSLNILLASLVIPFAGVIGARAFNWKVGLIAAALCATSARSAFWFSMMKEEGLATLASTLVVYGGHRLMMGDPSRLRWVCLGALASGSAVAFKYNALPAIAFFLLALLLAPAAKTGAGDTRKTTRLRFRVREILVYGFLSASAFLLWFHQLVLSPEAVRKGAMTSEQWSRLNVFKQETLSVGGMLALAWETWEKLFCKISVGDNYPYFFVVFITAAFVITPFVAVIRRRRFLLLLWVYVMILYLLIYYMWLVGHKMNHYFVVAIVPMSLIVACGLSLFCDWLTTPFARRLPRRPVALQFVLLLAICSWPLSYSYLASLRILDRLGGDRDARAARRTIVHRLPAGSRIFVSTSWLRPHISDSLFDNWHVPRQHEVFDNFGLHDLVYWGYRYVCIENYSPGARVKEPRYLQELTSRKAKPVYTLPWTSHFLPRFSYIPIQPDDGESFGLGLYFREPCAGDHAGVRGTVPQTSTITDTTTRTLTLNARLINGERWIPKYVRWEVMVDGKTVWNGRDTTDTKHVDLSLNIQARGGSEIMIRTMRTEFRQEDMRGWGGRPTELIVDGLQLIEGNTSEPVFVEWAYAGRNGGPGPCRYAMRGDWLDNEAAPALLDTGFEGEQPLVHAWRPYREIEPRDPVAFPEHARCRELARVETARSLGVDGSDALRLAMGIPAKESARLGVMQPMCHPASRETSRIRVHYRLEDAAGDRARIGLKLVATGLSLSGEYIDRAEVETLALQTIGQWNTLELDVEDAWKRRHTRVDLIEFLEVAVEVAAGSGCTFNYLIDNVELDR